MVHEQIHQFYSGLDETANLWRLVVGNGALSAFYHDSLDIANAQDRLTATIRLIAKMPTLVAMCYKYSLK